MPDSWRRQLRTKTDVLSLDALSAATSRELVMACTDIDDTITTDGRLSAAAYAALEALDAAGLAVVPITGRPAGWCDLIARLWPIAGVVGENGAFYFSYDRTSQTMRRAYVDTAEKRAEHRRELSRLAREIPLAIPGAVVAADQAYRETDLAIDFAEDTARLSDVAIDAIVAAFEAAGATAKVSSIHVNGWFGTYDKLTMTRRFVAEVLGVELDAVRERAVFVGDSPNDAPLFEYFPHSIGVANVLDFADTIQSLPTYVATARGGAGFVEVAQRILAGRSA